MKQNRATNGRNFKGVLIALQIDRFVVKRKRQKEKEKEKKKERNNGKYWRLRARKLKGIGRGKRRIDYRRGKCPSPLNFPIKSSVARAKKEIKGPLRSRTSERGKEEEVFSGKKGKRKKRGKRREGEITSPRQTRVTRSRLDELLSKRKIQPKLS